MNLRWRRSSKKTSNKHNPYAKMLKDMEKKLEKSYKKLDKDLKRSAPFKTIKQDNDELLILLGECNYIAKECRALEKKQKK